MVVILYYLLEALKWLIIIRALMSWFVAPGSDNAVARLIRRITDPILRPLSEMLPPMGGLDVSPLLAFFAIYLFQQLLIRMA
jgi:YggT family protein